MSHIVESCPLTKLNGGLSRLHSADEDAVSWLTINGTSSSRMHVMNHNWSEDNVNKSFTTVNIKLLYIIASGTQTSVVMD